MGYFNCCFMLAYDLVKTLKDPFESGELRTFSLYMKSMAFFVFYCIVFIALEVAGYRFSGGFYRPTCANVTFEDSMSGAETIVGVVFICYTFYALIVSARGLCRKGMNLETRKAIFGR